MSAPILSAADVAAIRAGHRRDDVNCHTAIGKGTFWRCARCAEEWPCPVEALAASHEELRAEVERLRGIEVDAIAVLSVAFPTTEVPWLQEIGVAAGASLLTAERDAALARIAHVEALHVSEPVPDSQHYYCDPDDCNRAGEGTLIDRCKVCETVFPCDTRNAATCICPGDICLGDTGNPNEYCAACAALDPELDCCAAPTEGGA